jgi:hypothetical protein
VAGPGGDQLIMSSIYSALYTFSQKIYDETYILL